MLQSPIEYVVQLLDICDGEIPAARDFLRRARGHFKSVPKRFWDACDDELDGLVEIGPDLDNYQPPEG